MPLSAGIATVKAAGSNMPLMDLIVPVCYLLTAIALAYFALELVFPALKARLFGAVAALFKR